MQAEELSYVIVTPTAIRRSRTGAIISRLISRTGLDLVSGRMFAPSDELARRYAEQVAGDSQLLGKYVQRNFSATVSGQRARVLLLVLRGENAVARTREALALIRETFGDDDPNHFEPALLAAADAQSAEAHLKLWARYSDSDGGVLDRVISYPDGAKVQKTLVLIKPDNFRFPSMRPGGIIEVFSRTGLDLIAFKVHHMSVAQAEEFYGPVLEVLEGKLGGDKGRNAWEEIVEFMAGARPSATAGDVRSAPGSQKIVALVYQGADAIAKIRDVLGPTDPAKAPPGTIRKEFGENIMVNAAHASDSAENAQREMRIVQVEENNLKPLIESFYAHK